MLMSATMRSRVDRRMGREILRPEQALLFSGDEHKQQRAFQLLGMLLERRGNIEQDGDAGRVVHGAVVNAVAIDRLADAHVIDVRGQNYVFILQLRIVSRQAGHKIGRLHRLLFQFRFGLDGMR